MLQTIYTNNYDIVGNSPAVIVENDFTGDAVIYLNNNVFPKLTPFQQKFVVQHELGHYVLNTDSEIEADTYAFDILAGTEFQSLKQCISAIYDLLPVMNNGRAPRLKSMIENALEWDAENGNEKAAAELYKVSAMDVNTFLNYFETNYLGIKKRGWNFWQTVAAAATGGISVIFDTVKDTVNNAVNKNNALKTQQAANEAAQKQYENETARQVTEQNSDLASQQQQTSTMMVVIMAIAAVLIMGD